MTTSTTELKTNITELNTKELEAIQGGGSTILGNTANLDTRLVGASNQERREYTVFS
jgi:bacteriocin-like protein